MMSLITKVKQFVALKPLIDFQKGSLRIGASPSFHGIIGGDMTLIVFLHLGVVLQGIMLPQWYGKISYAT